MKDFPTMVKSSDFALKCMVPKFVCLYGNLLVETHKGKNLKNLHKSKNNF